MKVTEAKGPPGASKLLAHIRATGLSIPRFSEEKGLDRQKVQRAINGALVRFDVDFALAVEEATDKAVVVADWRTPETEGEAPATEPAVQ